MPEAAQHTVPQQVNFNAAPTDSPILSQTMVGEVWPDQFPTTPPQDSETTLLQAHFRLPQSPAPADSLPGRIISLVANDPYVSDQKTVGSIDLRYVELVQNPETGNLTPLTTQSDTTSLTDSRFTEILGLTAVPGSETAQRFVQQKQRSWGPGMDAPVTDPAGQKTEARVAPVKISDPFMNEFSKGTSGQDIPWANPAEGIAASSSTQGTGEPADLFHSMASSQNTMPTAVLSQDGATVRPPAGFGNVIENRIIDHVIQQVSIRSTPEQSSISIRLHPEELGHLKMELVANNETIKAHIHVQTQQVQDIVEKNLARLREGFEQQGLVLDEIEVSVNSDSRSGPGLFNEQQTDNAKPQTANAAQSQESDDTISEETMIAPHRSDSIISLRI
jgi:flagellar hook-length control protein FliK